MTGAQDHAGRRLSEALHAQAVSGGRVPPERPPMDRRPRSRFGPPPPPPRMPGRVPPPVARPMAQQAAPARSNGRQIMWALIIMLLVGAILGGGIALMSVLLPGALPAVG